MQLHKNKILVTSIIYVAALLLLAAVFGQWHNQNLNGTGNYTAFVVLLFLVVACLSWLFISIFKEFKKENQELVASAEAEITEVEITETEQSEEKVIETFDKEAFIKAIVPLNSRNTIEFSEATLHNIATKLKVVQGLFYLKNGEEAFEPIARYAYYSDTTPPSFKFGESLPGQALKDKRVVIIQHIPENYIPVVSGLGSGKPKNLIMIPVYANSEPVGLIEVATFSNVETEMESALKDLGETIGKIIIKLMK